MKSPGDKAAAVWLGSPSKRKRLTHLPAQLAVAYVAMAVHLQGDQKGAVPPLIFHLRKKMNLRQ